MTEGTSMSKCSCWEECSTFVGREHYDGICIGPEGREYCKCNGDRSKCDFYSEKKGEDKTMKTIEMLVAAQKNDKTYYSEFYDISYSKSLGFIDVDENKDLHMNTIDDYFNDFLQYNWVEVDSMTRAEAEERYGVKIIG